MDIGTVLIWLSLILAIIAIILTVLELIFIRTGAIRESDFAAFYSKLVSIFLFASVTGTLLLLYVYFITSNVNIKYVWEYTSRSHPFEYKISGVIAGKAGSLLFWVWCMAFCWFIEEIIDLRKPKGKALMGWTRIIMMAIIAIFIFFLVLMELFVETPSDYLKNYPNGYGLNPLLQTPLMIIHPPVVFLAYGFIVICMAAAMAYLITDDKDWVKLSMPWSRWGWLFLTLGIGIGGLWAYVVLGWGGYWAWDPVETSSFLPWILLTAFLHAQLMNRRKGDFKIAAPALGIFSFVLVIFATFTTRAGGIWVSVHAFGEADVSRSPLDRLISELTRDNVILGFFILLIGLIIVGAILLIWAMIRRGMSEEEDVAYSEKGILEEIINDKVLMYVTLILLTIITIVTMFLLIMAVNGLDREQFDSKIGFLTMAGVVVLAFCLAWKYLGRVPTIITLLFTGIISGIFLIFFRNQWIVAVTMPFLLLACGASLYKIGKSINPRSLRGSINGIAPHLVHLGVVFIIIGFVGSNFLVTEKEITLNRDGPAKTVGDYEVKMVWGKIAPDESIFVILEITRDGEEIGYAKPGAILIDQQWRNEIDVESTPFEDMYLVFQNANIDTDGTNLASVIIQVKILPLMNVLWLGMWLMALGVGMRVVLSYIKPKKKKEEVVEFEPRMELPEEEGMDYEAMIEKELEEME